MVITVNCHHPFLCIPVGWCLFHYKMSKTPCEICSSNNTNHPSRHLTMSQCVYHHHHHQTHSNGRIVTTDDPLLSEYTPPPLIAMASKKNQQHGGSQQSLVQGCEMTPFNNKRVSIPKTISHKIQHQQQHHVRYIKGCSP